MIVGYKKLGMVLGAVAALALLPAKADAQFVRYSPIFWSFEGNVGVAIPVGDLGDLADPGVTFGAAASYFLNPRFALRAEGGLDLYEAPSGAPTDVDMKAWHATGGFEYHITDPTTSNVMFNIDLGAGLVAFDTDAFQVGAPPAGFTISSFDQTYFALNGGLQLGVNLARHASTNVPIATLFIAGDIHFMFADAADSQLLAQFYGASSGFDTGLAIPITGGLRFNIP